MRIAIYARMSTDKQSADSPADQIARCREFAERKGWEVVPDLIAQDAGISGASRHNRPGLLELVARIDEWDVLLCWEFSRLARDSEDLGWIRNRLRFHKRTSFEASTGLDLFNVGAKVMGVLAEEYLMKLRADVQRGLRGRVERKLSAGGRPYGYRTEPVPSGQVDPHGREIPAGYRFVIDQEQAAVVRRLFMYYLRGEGLRTLAHRLNREGAPPPRPRRNKGKTPSWTVSSIRSMLLSPIYKGEYVYNRTEWVKDHETGKRRRYPRPESEWLRQEDESWRIVEPRLWEDVQELMRSKRGAFRRRPDGSIVSHTNRAAKRRHLLSGLLECAECGGSFFALRVDQQYGCGWHRDRGPEVCTSALMVPRPALEERVVGAIRDRILTPENVTYAVQRAMETMRRSMDRAEPEADRQRLAELETKIERAIDLAVETGGIAAVKQKLAALEAEREQLEARIRSREGPAADPSEHLETIRRRVLDLREAFGGAPDECRGALATLLAGGRIRVGEDAERDFRIEGLFWLPSTSEPPGAHASGRFDCVVAGARYHREVPALTVTLETAA